MKIKSIIAITLLLMAFSSCTKCVTCVAYYSTNNCPPPDTLGAVSSNTQSVKVCNKAQIDAYEAGTNYTSPNGCPVIFQCK